MEKYFQQTWSFFNSFAWDQLRNNNFITVGVISGVALLVFFLLCILCVRLYSKLFFLHKSKKSDREFDFDDKCKLNVAESIKQQLGELFLRHVKEFMEENFESFLKTRSPIVYQENKSRKIILKCFPNDEEDKIIEELYIFWELGFRHSKLPLVFMIYFASIKKENLMSILSSFLDYPNIDASQKKLLWLYFQDLLTSFIDIVTFPLDEIENIYRTENLLLSRVISAYQGEWNITTFKEQVNSFQLFKAIEYRPPMREFLILFLSKSTQRLNSYIVLNFTKFLGNIAGDMIAQLVFKSGNYKKLLKITHPSKELQILTHSIFQNVQKQEDLRSLHTDQDAVITYLSKQKYAKLHICYYLKAIDMPLSTAQHYQLDCDEVEKTMKEAASLPIGIRWLFFQYLVYMEKWHQALKLFEMLGLYKNRISGKIFRLRCLFYNTDQMSEKKRYLNEIKKISEENSENLAIMNEYAIHCIEVNKILDAQRALKKMQKKSLNHPVALYNQALLFENLYSEAIKQKWRKLHQARVS